MGKKQFEWMQRLMFSRLNLKLIFSVVRTILTKKYFYNVGQNEQFQLSPILSFGILLGLLTALIFVIIAIVAILKFRTINNKKSSNKQQRTGVLPIKEKISLPLSQSEEMYDEKNPDVVPSNESGKKMTHFLINFLRFSLEIGRKSLLV